MGGSSGTLVKERIRRVESQGGSLSAPPTGGEKRHFSFWIQETVPKERPLDSGGSSRSISGSTVECVAMGTPLANFREYDKGKGGGGERLRVSPSRIKKERTRPYVAPGRGREKTRPRLKAAEELACLRGSSKEGAELEWIARRKRHPEIDRSLLKGVGRERTDARSRLY